MNREDTIRMVRESGIRSPDLYKLTVSHMSIETLERFAELVAAYEREACARVCDARYMGDKDMEARRCAEAIRKR